MDYLGLRRLARALEQLRDLERISTALVFINSITQPGIIMTELAEDLEASMSGVSRNLAILGDLRWDKRPGLDLLRHYHDHAVSSRHKRIDLTEKGATLAAKLERIIRP